MAHSYQRSRNITRRCAHRTNSFNLYNPTSQPARAPPFGLSPILAFVLDKNSAGYLESKVHWRVRRSGIVNNNTCNPNRKTSTVPDPHILEWVAITRRVSIYVLALLIWRERFRQSTQA